MYSEEEIAKKREKLESWNANCAIEGIYPDKEDDAFLEKFITGEISKEEAIQQIKDEFGE